MNAIENTFADYTPVDEQNTLLGQYATEKEIAHVRDAFDAIRVAERKQAHVESVLYKVSEKVSDARTVRRADIRRAAALALGEEVAAIEPVPRGPHLIELETQEKGLEQRAAEAKQAVVEARGNFRAAIHDLIRLCAERCAEDYERFTRRQAWCHQQLAIAQKLVNRIVDADVWNKYAVPASHHVRLLRQNAREENFIPMLMSADRLSLTERAEFQKLREHGKELFGEWPF